LTCVRLAGIWKNNTWKSK